MTVDFDIVGIVAVAVAVVAGDRTDFVLAHDSDMVAVVESDIVVVVESGIVDAA